MQYIGHDNICHILAVLRLNDLEGTGQGQRLLRATHSLILVIICAKYGKNTSRTVHAVERTRQDVPYFISFTAKPWLNALKYSGQVQRMSSATHPLTMVIICAKYGNNPPRTVDAVERTRHDMSYFSSFIAKSWLNDLEDKGQGQRSCCATHPFMLGIICA